MKKSIALVALAFGVTNAFAQDLTSKKGEPILPEAGDWSIGIDASSFLNYAGNFFGKTGPNVAPSFNWLTNNNTIVGKYFIDAQTAYRGGVRIGFNNDTKRFTTDDRAAAGTSTVFPNANPTKENTWKTSMTAIGLSAGIEKRKGKTRLQGFYGAEVGIYYSKAKDKFTYGNALVAPGTGVTNPVTVDPIGDAIPGTTNIDNAPPIQNVTTDGARITEIKHGAEFSFGARAFIGVEYFILPKISLGGEFGWGLGLTTIGKTTTSYESIGTTAAGNAVGTTSIDGSKSGSFKLDTDNKNSIWGASAALRLNFYF